MVIFAPKDMLNHQQTDPRNGIHHPQAQPQSFNFRSQLFEQPDGKRHVPAKHLAEQRQLPKGPSPWYPPMFFTWCGWDHWTIGDLRSINLQHPAALSCCRLSRFRADAWHLGCTKNHCGSSCESWNNL